jgi:ComF family protein
MNPSTNTLKRMVAEGRLTSVAGNLAQAVCDLLFPPWCILCHANIPPKSASPQLCTKCAMGTGPEYWAGCPRCGSAMPMLDPAAGRCALCVKTDLCFDHVVALGYYHAGLRDVVLRMKHAHQDILALAVSRLLAQRRQRELAAIEADCIVPIPMFWMRKLNRGMNSPDFVSHCLSRSLKIPVRRHVLIRCRNTLPQKNLRPAERFLNMAGAFRIRRKNAIRGAKVLLVDDVLTTGATCSEAAKILKEAGAASVAVAVIAKAQGNKHGHV